ncbi:hypothetical protein [Streptomyces sp. NPDC060366]|uniref:hypothetical protein n=1 Tax=Streptomyces sp. NPDC060366 TaxID=3347105 RepID=UPI003668F23B
MPMPLPQQEHHLNHHFLAGEFARFTDRRLAPVLRALASEEALLALTWAYGKTSWERAAASAGLPEACGERVRRKLKRLGARYLDRAAAAERRTEWS